jgi:Zn-finger nucleic acid-binding protein
MARSKERRLGKLPPRYNFVLNPYSDARFTRCPKCGQKTRVRKLPLFIHADPLNPVALNKTCRYCPRCDLLIAHRDELEAVLLRMFPDRDPEAFRDEYLVMGTVERRAYRQGLKSSRSIPEMLEHIHDFKEVWKVAYTAQSRFYSRP